MFPLALVVCVYFGAMTVDAVLIQGVISRVTVFVSLGKVPCQLDMEIYYLVVATVSSS